MMTKELNRKAELNDEMKKSRQNDEVETKGKEMKKSGWWRIVCVCMLTFVSHSSIHSFATFEWESFLLRWMRALRSTNAEKKAKKWNPFAVHSFHRETEFISTFEFARFSHARTHTQCWINYSPLHSTGFSWHFSLALISFFFVESHLPKL